MSVLVLCDDLMFTSKVSATGRAHGISVRVRRDPASVLQDALSLKPTCVIVDLHLPNLDLPRLLVTLREVCSPAPRVIGFGSHVDIETLRAARAAGCDQVLPRSQFTSQLETELPVWSAPSPAPPE